MIESPADDTPRLVYADWLEDNGQSDRAAFIRGGKMAIEINGQRYEVLIGTLVAPEVGNAAFIELNARETPGPNPVLFALRENATGKVKISMYREDVPLEVLTSFLSFVEQEFARWPLWQEPSDAAE
jgi:uncharacterized protein (TIGR02996 family)